MSRPWWDPIVYKSTHILIIAVVLAFLAGVILSGGL